MPHAVLQLYQLFFLQYINYQIPVKLYASIACQFIRFLVYSRKLPACPLFPLPSLYRNPLPCLSCSNWQELSIDKWHRNFFDNCC